MLDKINISLIANNLRKKSKGVEKYLYLMNNLHNFDVSKHGEFQRAYNGFYRMRQRSESFYKTYFEYMEKHKSAHIDFEDVLAYLHHSTERFEASFSSKLLATINANKPVWDANVLSQLSIKAPSYSSKNRFNRIVDTYSRLVEWYVGYLETQNAKDAISTFDEVFPDTSITDVKKIDFALWSMGIKD